MSQPEVTMMPMTQLPSGVIIRLDKIMFIARQELNQYVAFVENMPRSPFLTGEDLDALRALGAIQVLERPLPDNTEDAVIIATDGKKD